ncbi:MAG TPA: c-type cytochrome [Terracidiphilus sp.]|jgi:glucose dehydrogenase|nr:c-type cytochrome [Terracidiphilus sp.]
MRDRRLLPTLPSAIALGLLSLALLPASGQKDRDWPAYNGGLDGDHYSPLKQINRANVHHLRVAWSFDTGEKGQIQTNPLIIGRTLFGFTPSQKIIALDAATGQLQWKFDSGINGTQPSRGFSYWTDGKERLLFAGIMNFLYCLDPATGKPIASFGEQGRIDLRKGLGRNFETQSIVLTSPGVIYNDVIIVGGRNPETHPAPPGYIRAFDIHTGQQRWIFHTIPLPGEPGYETWPKDAWKTAGAANNWAGMTLDAKHGIVYVPTGSAVMDFYGGDRVGNDLYANCLLALDAATGKLLWHFQGVHHDIWDRDFPSPPALFTIKKEGKSIDALAQTSKQGYLYLFNRITGEPLFPMHEHPYPASNVPGEVSAPTQPLPDWPEPFAQRQKLTEDMLTTRTPDAHAWAVQTFRNLRSNGQFYPMTVGQQTVVFPGFDGGAEWGGPAIDPVSNILFVNENEMAWLGSLIPRQKTGSFGEQVYKDQCAMCHGVDRAGDPPTFPSLVGIEKRMTTQKLTDAIRQGSGRMPSFPDMVGDHLQALLDYLRTAPETSASKELTSSPAAKPNQDPAGAAAYQEHCAICHGDHQEGIPPSFPMLKGVGSRLSETQVVDLIHKGKGRMPPMPSMMGDELKALLDYLSVRPTGAAQEQDAEDAYTFTGYKKFLDPDGYPAIATPWGTLNAIDLKTGRALWKTPLGEYPDLVSKGLKATGSENYGGPIVTAGGVLFIGATVYDRKFHAFDTRTGKLLWEFELPFAGMATPSTYMIEGKQYVVTVSSGGRDPKSPTGGAYIGFALPK